MKCIVGSESPIIMPVAQKSEQKLLEHYCVSCISCLQHPGLENWACVTEQSQWVHLPCGSPKGIFVLYVTLGDDEKINAEVKFKLYLVESEMISIYQENKIGMEEMWPLHHILDSGRC